MLYITKLILIATPVKGLDHVMQPWQWELEVNMDVRNYQQFLGSSDKQADSNSIQTLKVWEVGVRRGGRNGYRKEGSKDKSLPMQQSQKLSLFTCHVQDITVEFEMIDTDMIDSQIGCVLKSNSQKVIFFNLTVPISSLSNAEWELGSS